jgi:hypothetical protein
MGGGGEEGLALETTRNPNQKDKRGYYQSFAFEYFWWIQQLNRGHNEGPKKSWFAKQFKSELQKMTTCREYWLIWRNLEDILCSSSILFTSASLSFRCHFNDGVPIWLRSHHIFECYHFGGYRASTMSHQDTTPHKGTLPPLCMAA